MLFTLITAITAAIAVLLYSGTVHNLILWIGENFQWEDSKKK
jgi:hypothetical protein